MVIFHSYFSLPSGYVKIAIENDPLIVDLPIKDDDFPYVSLSEGNSIIHVKTRMMVVKWITMVIKY